MHRKQPLQHLDCHRAGQLVRRGRHEARDAGRDAERVRRIEPGESPVHPLPQVGRDVLGGREGVPGDHVGAGEERVGLALEGRAREEVVAEHARPDEFREELLQEAGRHDRGVEAAAQDVLHLAHVVAGVEDDLRAPGRGGGLSGGGRRPTLVPGILSRIAREFGHELQRRPLTILVCFARLCRISIQV